MYIILIGRNFDIGQVHYQNVQLILFKFGKIFFKILFTV